MFRTCQKARWENWGEVSQNEEKKQINSNYPLWFDLFLLAVLFLRQFFHRNYIIMTIRLRLNDGLEI